MTMKISAHRIDLTLVHPFTIARGTRDSVGRVILELEHEGIVGIGEAAPSDRYGESPETVTAFLGRLDPDHFADPFETERILEHVNAAAEGNAAAKAAVDLALHDWIGKRLGVPLWKLFGLRKDDACRTSFTIGIDSPEVIEQKVREAEPFPILKVKVGVQGDETIIATIRSLTGKVLRVDANEGWKSREQALEKILWLEQQGVEFVEQPLPAQDLDGMRWVRERVHIPLIADESVQRLPDLPRLAGAFDGINIKLMKCTGLREGLRMIHTARALGLKIMLGCMVESSVAVSAAAQLSPLADYADLDGNLLVSDDPFRGVVVKEGRLILNDRPGLGITRVHS